nr:40S ribosomal protein S3A [Cryptomonas paramecium]
MTIGKNKKLAKYNKNEKKNSNFFDKKEWVDMKIPSFLGKKTFGKTLINKNREKKVEDSSKKIYKVSLADLNKNEDLSFKKIKLKHVDSRDVLLETKFYGLELTRDKISSLIRKWQTLVETNVDIKTQEKYIVRIFVIVFPKKKKMQKKKTTYLNSTQTRTIRRKITEILIKEMNEIQIDSLVEKVLSDQIIYQIEKKCRKTFPLYNLFVNKIKILDDGNL